MSKVSDNFFLHYISSTCSKMKNHCLEVYTYKISCLGVRGWLQLYENSAPVKDPRCSNIFYVTHVTLRDILLYIRDAVEMFMDHHASEDVTCLDVTEIQTDEWEFDQLRTGWYQGGAQCYRVLNRWPCVDIVYVAVNYFQVNLGEMPIWWTDHLDIFQCYVSGTQKFQFLDVRASSRKSNLP